MTREETVKNLLTELIDMIDNGSQRDLDRADEIAKTIIKALSQVPCGDAISREDALKLIYDFKEKHTEDREKHPINYGTLLDLIRLIRELPPVTQKSGKWIKMFLTDTGDIDGQCSECGFIHKFIDGHTAQYNFCPNCGARMESEGKE